MIFPERLAGMNRGWWWLPFWLVWFFGWAPAQSVSESELSPSLGTHVHAAGLEFRSATSTQALIVPTPAGDPAPEVEMLVDRALSGAPSLAAMRARLDAARQMIAPAGALPDPMFETMLQNVGLSRWTVNEEEMSMVNLEFRQEFPFPGKQQTRQQIACAEAQVRAAELQAAARELAMNLRMLYARLYMLNQEQQALELGRGLLNLLAETASGRFVAGRTNQEAVLKAQLEVSRLLERQTDLEADYKTAEAGINKLLDRSGSSVIGIVTQLPQPALPNPPWEELAAAQAPEVLVKQAAVAVAEQRLTAAQLELRPDYYAGAGVGMRELGSGKPEMNFDPVVSLRLGMQLPLWLRTKQGPMIQAAVSELEMACQEWRDAQAEARSQAARLAAVWQKVQTQLPRFQQEIVPQSESVLEAARTEYETGTGDFSVVVEDFNLWLEARTQLAARQAEQFETWAAIRALTSVEPMAVGAEGAQP